MFFPQFRWLKPLGFSNGGCINTNCFDGAWNPRVKSKLNLLFSFVMVKGGHEPCKPWFMGYNDCRNRPSTLRAKVTTCDSRTELFYCARITRIHHYSLIYTWDSLLIKGQFFIGSTTKSWSQLPVFSFFERFEESARALRRHRRLAFGAAGIILHGVSRQRGSVRQRATLQWGQAVEVVKSSVGIESWVWMYVI